MQAVSRGSSEEVLRLLDRLVSEGHSPTHFARQMVRFVRNTIVAKVAGPDSSLLQISSDERARVARVAELFSEEDLARHLQIMLRTHSELGYKHEQRFHLELGLLKMAHAQRLLPLEQLLSEAAAQVNSPPRPQGTAPVRTSAESRRTTSDPGTATRSNYVSPFAADSARKGTPKAEIASEPASQAGPRLVATASATAVVMGATAPAPAVLNAPKIATGPEPVALAEEPAISESVPVNSDVSALRNSILNAVADAGHRMVTSMLESGEWRVEGNELQIKVAASPTVIDMSLGADAKRVIVAAASGVLGKPAKLNVISGGTATQNSSPATRSNGSGRGRAEQEPVVQRMREKFGAEIRTIIDYRDKR
jgi:DNA polymerase-3 subunit gamma/tau